MTDRRLGKLSKYTVRGWPSPSSGGVGCWLSHISYRFETTPVHERLLAAGFPSFPPVIAGNQSRAVEIGRWVEGSIEFLRPRSRVAYLLPKIERERERGEKDLTGRFEYKGDRTRSDDEGRNYSKCGAIRVAWRGVAWRGAFYSLRKSNAEIRAKIPDSPENPGNARSGVSCGAYARALPTIGPFLHVYMQRLRWTGFPTRTTPG